MPFRIFSITALCLCLPAHAEDTAFVGAHGALTPGSYTGSDGDVTEQLDLWPDQSFHLVDGAESHAGRWYADPDTNSIVLDLGGDLRSLEVRNSQVLRPDGAADDGFSDLTASDEFSPTAISLHITGMFSYFADAPTIVHCATGRSYPLAQDQDYLVLEKAYLNSRSAPAEPLFVTLKARIEMREQMEGPARLTVVPESFGAVYPGEDCSLGNKTLVLTDAVWSIRALGNAVLGPGVTLREPFMILREDGTFSASVGCNQMRGSFSQTADTMSFDGPVASTMMACPEPVASWEVAFTKALANISVWEVGGRSLRLRDADGNVVADLRAVYLP